MFMPAPSISTVTTTALNIPTLTIYEDFDKIIAKEVCFTETGDFFLSTQCPTGEDRADGRHAKFLF